MHFPLHVPDLVAYDGFEEVYCYFCTSCTDAEVSAKFPWEADGKNWKTGKFQ